MSSYFLVDIFSMSVFGSATHSRYVYVIFAEGQKASCYVEVTEVEVQSSPNFFLCWFFMTFGGIGTL